MSINSYKSRTFSLVHLQLCAESLRTFSWALATLNRRVHRCLNEQTDWETVSFMASWSNFAVCAFSAFSVSSKSWTCDTISCRKSRKGVLYKNMSSKARLHLMFSNVILYSLKHTWYKQSLSSASCTEFALAVVNSCILFSTSLICFITSSISSWLDLDWAMHLTNNRCVTNNLVA